MTEVRYPQLRDEVIAALRSLASRTHQRLRWGVVQDGVAYYEDLTLVVNVLYDDAQVLPVPQRAVGSVIYDNEVSALSEVNAALAPLLDELGEAPDEVYTSDERWPAVLAAAGSALHALEAGEARSDGDAGVSE